MCHDKNEFPRFRLMGDQGLLVELGTSIDPEVNQRIRALGVAVEKARFPGLVEVIPAYSSLLVVYDPLRAHPRSIEEHVRELIRVLPVNEMKAGAIIHVPVCYGGEYGPDIFFVAEYNLLDVEDVIRIHASIEYPVFMVGFMPGFPYLGGLPEKLHTPRLPSPRARVPEGAVGIANDQTGIYPASVPGGWRLIGRTPLKLFAPERPEPFLYSPGDRIRFQPISPERFQRIFEEESRQ